MRVRSNCLGDRCAPGADPAWFLVGGRSSPSTRWEGRVLHDLPYPSRGRALQTWEGRYAFHHASPPALTCGDIDRTLVETHPGIPETS